MTADGGTRRAPRPEAADTAENLVRVSLLVRLVALVFAIVVLAAQGGPVIAAVLVICLTLTSHLGLQRPRVRRLVVRHPIVALPDVLLVAAVPVLVGIDSPLTLVSLSSALLIGVLFPLRTVIPLGLLLIATHAAAAAAATSGDPVAAARQPVVLVCVTAMGVAFRRMSERQQHIEREVTAARSAEAAARERLRLARDLHDTVAKACQGVALTASALPGWMQRNPAVAERHANAVADGARDAVTAARQLMTSLRSDTPEGPLAAVLNDLADRVEDEHGLSIERDLEETDPLPSATHHEVTCAVSEALENVSRHAPGARVVMRLTQDDDVITVMVIDDGPGFDARRERDATHQGHYGLTGIRERVASIGGRALIRSHPGRGTQVSLTVGVQGQPVTADPVPTRGDLSARHPVNARHEDAVA